MAFNEYYNSEHNRLLNLWRDVVSVKRLFTEMKFATERDLTKLRGQVGGLANDVLSACSSTSFFLKLQAAATGGGNQTDKTAPQFGSSVTNLADEASMSSALQAAQAEIHAKDQRIQQLLREVSIENERSLTPQLTPLLLAFPRYSLWRKSAPRSRRA